MDKTTSSSNKTSSISTQVIHVRSRDFSDLVEKFANIQEEMVDIRSGSPLDWNEEDYLASQFEHHIKNHTRTESWSSDRRPRPTPEQLETRKMRCIVYLGFRVARSVFNNIGI